mmetsp:Transcript_26708/g.23671  ORF Transcript_26708/g.23671 Transcript_26708/m.23671 type:complete len:80 (-) Transcript_26708:1782-2021(-)
MIAKNQRLKDEVDTLRRERLIYKDISEQLTEELSKKKDDLDNLQKKSMKAENKRDNIKRELDTLKEKAKSEDDMIEKEF